MEYIRCNMCEQIWKNDDDVPYLTITHDDGGIEHYRGCDDCETDEYLMDCEDDEGDENE